MKKKTTKASSKGTSTPFFRKKETEEKKMSKAKQSVDNNPFEKIMPKKKFETVGERMTVQRRSHARAEAVERRKKTLLVEYQNLHKRNAFVDRRIGEGDPELGEEEKMLARLQTERKKGGSKFNLEDGEEATLTHYGRTLGEYLETRDQKKQERIEAKAQKRDREDEEEDGPMPDADDADLFQKMRERFGEIGKPMGGADGEGSEGDEEGAPDRKRKKQEVMDEVIAKSKHHRQERAKEKERTEDLVAEIDAAFADIRGIIMSNKADHSSNEAGDDFDKEARVLAFEKRAYATDRLKTEEEIAQDEKERLDRLEADRIRRMRGDLPSDEEEELEDLGGKKKPKRLAGGKKGESHNSADALAEQWVNKGRRRGEIVDGSDEENGGDEDDSVTEESESGSDSEGEGSESEEEEEGGMIASSSASYFLDPEAPSGDTSALDSSDMLRDDEEEGEGEHEGKMQVESEGEESEDEGSEAGESFDFEQLGEDDVLSSGDESDSEEKAKKEEQSQQQQSKKGVKARALAPIETAEQRKKRRGDEDRLRKQMMESAAKELPYVFECPEDLKALQELFKGRTFAQREVIVERLFKYYNPKLSAANKRKMEDFFGVLLDYYVAVSAETPLDVRHITSLRKNLYDLSKAVPNPACNAFRVHLAKIYKNFLEKLESKESTWLSVSDTMVLYLGGTLFPSSDFRHAICTPALVILSHALSACHVRSVKDVACALLLCHIVFSYVAASKRLVSEVITFLFNALSTLPTTSPVSCPTVPKAAVYGPSALRFANPSGVTGGAVRPLKFSDFFGAESDSLLLGNNLDVFRTSLVHSLLKHVGRFADLYASSPSLPELFAPLVTLLKAIDKSQIPSALHAPLASTLEELEKLTSRAITNRKPLRLQTFKPVPLRQFNPRFDESFGFKIQKGFKGVDPNLEGGSGGASSAPPSREEMKSLKKQHRQEFRGAVRELRKDARFMQEQEEKQRRIEDAEREAKYRKAMAFLGEQQAQINMLDNITQKNRYTKFSQKGRGGGGGPKGGRGKK